MGSYRLDFVIHWLWTITFGLLSITGLTLLGPRFGWITNYNVALADYLHRTVATLFTFLTLVAILLEIICLIKKEPKKQPWLIFKKSGFGLLNFIVANVMIITGILIWICMGYDHSIAAFASVVHEMATFVMIFSIVWHVYMKSHVLLLELGGNKKMVRNKLFRFVYWLTGSFFFFAASTLIISYLRLGPTENQVETWMAGMMSAMHGSLMGVTMDAPEIYSILLSQSAQITVLMIFLGLITGLAIRVWKAHDQR